MEAVAAALRTHAQPGGDCVVAVTAVDALHWVTKGGAGAKGAAAAAGALGLARTALATHADADRFEDLQYWVADLEEKMG